MTDQLLRQQWRPKMATKIFCDGCDTDITDDKGDARKGLRINTTTQAGQGEAVLGQFQVGPFDLCGQCVRRFREDVNPKTWARYHEAKRVA
jgi:hypothetical protein